MSRAGRAAALALAALAAGACASGPPDRAEPPGDWGIELTAVTWNLLHGVAPGGRPNLDEKARALAAFDADLVFVQEIDERCERSGRVDQMAVLAEETGLDAAFGSFMPYQGGRYGLGTLSTLPVVATRSLRLPDGDEPRVALVREVTVLGATLVTVGVHFNWTRDDTSRFAQARALLDFLATDDRAMVVAGDFNDLPESRTLEAFYSAGFEHADPPAPTFDARAPSVDIDHILIRDGADLDLEPLTGDVVAETELSDHRPVRARIRAFRR